MGVKLTDLIKDYGKAITFTNLMNKKISVDAFNVIYQFLATIRGADGQPLKNFKGETTSHLKGIFNRTINLLEYDIKPVYIFDGAPNKLKAKEISRRHEVRKIAEKNLEKAVDDDNKQDIKKYAQGTSKLTGKMIEDTKKLLSAMGIPFITAPQDGEAQGAHLVRKNEVFAVASQDYDAFLFGSPRIIRNLSISQTRTFQGRKIEEDIMYYNAENVLKQLEISREQLVDIGILVGVDFFEGIKGIGEKTAIKLIKQYGSLNNLINKKDNEDLQRYDFSPISPEIAEDVWNIFLRPNVTDNYEKPIWKKANRDEIINLLVQEHNFNQDLVENAIKRLIKKQSSKTQTRLDGFVK